MVSQPGQRRARWCGVVLGLVTCGAALGCNEQGAAPEPLWPEDVRPYLTAATAAELTPEGRFVLPPPPPEPYPQITAEQARELAVAWARTFGRYHSKYLERDHGGPIDFFGLEAAAPPYYAASSYEPVGPEAHPGMRNSFGPYFLVYLVDNGRPIINLAVAAFTESTVEQGEMRMVVSKGGDFIHEAVPEGQGFVMPLSAERAAQIAAEATGSLVAAVPELVLPELRYSAHHARWKVLLDRPVNARLIRTGTVRMTSEVYVGLRGEVTIPAVVQPPGSAVYDPSRRVQVQIRRRAGRPVLFERVSIPGQ